jgi:uncharacterized protein
MDIQLTEIEARILGSLIEKELTTPDYYPLSLNSLINACNQKSSRHPVMNLGEADVEGALKTLREKKLVWEVHSSGSRTVKFRHDIGEVFKLSKIEIACICLLLLRGPSTIGEIRTNSSRLHDFGDLDEVERTLNALQEKDGGPFVMKLPRRTGQKENRYAHLFCGDAVESDQNIPDEMIYPDRVENLEKRVSSLEDEIDKLKKLLETIKG